MKYIGRAHAKHLVTTLPKYQTLKTYWGGTLYCGISLKWGYTRYTVDLNMLGYINLELLKYQRPEPQKPQHAPYQW